MTVQQDGRIRFDGGLFGDAITQSEMLRHRGKKVLVGFNPKNFDEPAVVFHWAQKANRGRLILESLPAVIETQHGSAEDKRNATAEKRRVGELIKKLKVENPDADVAAIRAGIARKERPDRTRDRRDARIVELPTNTGFSIGETVSHEATVSHLTEERIKNFEESTRRLQASRS